MRANIVGLVAWLGLSGSALAKNRLALVIGNDSYEHVDRLQKARADAKGYADLLRPWFPAERERMKDTVVGEVVRGLALTSSDVRRARAGRHRIDVAVRTFFDRFDALVLPVSQVAPFPVEVEWPTEIAGHPMGTYIDWMASCWMISVTGCPSVAVPCGQTSAGLPVGLQIVTAPGRDLAALRLAAAFEVARPFSPGTGARG